MTATNKARGKAQSSRSKVKKPTGRAMSDPMLDATGKTEPVKGDMRQTGPKVREPGKR